MEAITRKKEKGKINANRGDKMENKVKYEMTDTFGDEANYSWVKRGEFTYDANMSDTAIVRKVKKALEITGVRCKKTDFGDTIVLDIVGACVRIFITFGEVGD